MNGMYPVNPLTVGSANFNPYYTPIQNPIVPNYPVIQNQPLTSRRKIDCVNGIESAYTFPMGPNESAILVDNLSPRIFFVTTDASGYKAVKPFKISADEEAANTQPIEGVGTVTEKENDVMNQLTERIEKLEKRMSDYEQPSTTSQSNSRSFDNGKPSNATTQPNDRNSQGSKGSNGGNQSNGTK